MTRSLRWIVIPENLPSGIWMARSLRWNVFLGSMLRGRGIWPRGRGLLMKGCGSKIEGRGLLVSRTIFLRDWSLRVRVRGTLIGDIGF